MLILYRLGSWPKSGKRRRVSWISFCLMHKRNQSIFIYMTNLCIGSQIETCMVLLDMKTTSITSINHDNNPARHDHPQNYLNYSLILPPHLIYIRFSMTGNWGFLPFLPPTRVAVSASFTMFKTLAVLNEWIRTPLLTWSFSQYASSVSGLAL